MNEIANIQASVIEIFARHGRTQEESAIKGLLPFSKERKEFLKNVEQFSFDEQFTWASNLWKVAPTAFDNAQVFVMGEVDELAPVLAITRWGSAGLSSSCSVSGAYVQMTLIPGSETVTIDSRDVITGKSLAGLSYPQKFVNLKFFSNAFDEESGDLEGLYEFMQSQVLSTNEDGKHQYRGFEATLFVQIQSLGEKEDGVFTDMVVSAAVVVITKKIKPEPISKLLSLGAIGATVAPRFIKAKSALEALDIISDEDPLG